MIYRFDDEIKLKNRLMELFVEWQAVVARTKSIPRDVKDSFVTDGFYPGYLRQKVKVLFIGRESLSIEGDFMECLYDAYREGRVGGKHLNKYQMHYLQFYLAFGFNHRFPKWKSIPFATELASRIGMEDGISFAFINASKFSNWDDNWQLNRSLFGLSLDISSTKRFLRRQIEVLRPDVICSMNVLGLAGGQIGDYSHVESLSHNDLDVYDYVYEDGVAIPLLDMWHFAAPRKRPYDNYYRPIVDIYGKLCQRYQTIDR